ncbi:MAG TPA: glycosyltransferase family 4 protein [Candidatus Angelobacter sp.]|nr:glycosyltransferase family 4 protein [Candidatus Angelobacter sp.]
MKSSTHGNGARSLPRLLFLFADDRFFWSHRLPMARAALRNGYEVIVATGVYAFGEEIKAEGFRLIQLDFTRKTRSLFNELRAIREIRSTYKKEQPDIVHQVAIKPVLFGSIAAVGLERRPVINALTGLGYLVASSSKKASFLRSMVWRIFRSLLGGAHQRVLVENQDDRDLVVSRLAVPENRVIVTRGSGVDIKEFPESDEPAGIPVVALAARMLWIKGIADFVAAAGLLRKMGIRARFVLVGDSDANNPSCVPREQLLEWDKNGQVEWWGHQQDMPALFKKVSLVCLPSHGGEGVPKVLMEAAASGRAIVTTDVPGCREVVRSGINGVLVQPRDVQALAGAIEHLVQDAQLRQRMGKRSRELAVAEFSEDAVIRQTLTVYDEMLHSFRPTLKPALEVGN